jgi:hypothetical protein
MKPIPDNLNNVPLLLLVNPFNPIWMVSKPASARIFYKIIDWQELPPIPEIKVPYYVVDTLLLVIHKYECKSTEHTEILQDYTNQKRLRIYFNKDEAINDLIELTTSHIKERYKNL